MLFIYLCIRINLFYILYILGNFILRGNECYRMPFSVIMYDNAVDEYEDYLHFGQNTLAHIQHSNMYIL